MLNVQKTELLSCSNCTPVILSINCPQFLFFLSFLEKPLSFSHFPSILNMSNSLVSQQTCKLNPHLSTWGRCRPTVASSLTNPARQPFLFTGQQSRATEEFSGTWEDHAASLSSSPHWQRLDWPEEAVKSYQETFPKSGIPYKHNDLSTILILKYSQSSPSTQSLMHPEPFEALTCLFLFFPNQEK